MDMVQSDPAVTNVRESAKSAHDNWPTCKCSKCPRSYHSISNGLVLLSTCYSVPFYYPQHKIGRCHQRNPIPCTCHRKEGRLTGMQPYRAIDLVSWTMMPHVPEYLSRVRVKRHLVNREGSYQARKQEPASEILQEYLADFHYDEGPLYADEACERFGGGFVRSYV